MYGHTNGKNALMVALSRSFGWHLVDFHECCLGCIKGAVLLLLIATNGGTYAAPFAVYVPLKKER